MSLEIKNLTIEIEGKTIIDNLSLTLEKGKIIALMGPNGSGKSTLANTLMGNPSYEITKGQILLDGTDITSMEPDERAKLGLFLSFQYPVEIPGVSITSFLRKAYNSVKETNIDVMSFHNLLKEKMSELKIPEEFRKRSLNTGFSGGEKKRNEILQLSILDPKYAIMDETDSGLDVDALKVVAEGINKLKTEKNTFLIITHYNRILHHIVPDKVIVMKEGKIIKEGEKELAKEIEENGFE